MANHRKHGGSVQKYTNSDIVSSVNAYGICALHF